MHVVADMAATAHPRRSRTSPAPSTAPTAPTAPTASPTYGYHNTYHTHVQLPLGPPPVYACANDPKTLSRLQDKAQTEAACSSALPPAYSCSVHLAGVLGVKPELSSPFRVSGSREWFDAFVLLQGTQLSIHRVKGPGLLSKSRSPTPGKLIHSYSLQHAEVGVASDFKKTPLTPKSPFAHLVPASTRRKLYKTDPHLFEPVREHAIRLRLETEQFLICTQNHEAMLDWIESLCAAIDISPPIEDRSEPRYRSLPRRSRRQRILDSAQMGGNMENLSSLEAGRRIIAQQEQIIRQLYPHLAGSAARTRDTRFGVTTTVSATATSAPNPPEVELLDDFDPEDVRFPTPTSSSESHDDDVSATSASSSDRKNIQHPRPSPSQILRYRRRCAPVLLASSPRVSDVVFSQGTRKRIDINHHILIDYESLPPRYDAHNFPKQKRTKPQRPLKTNDPERPGSPNRADSDDSITSISFGEDMDLSAGLGPSQSADDVSANVPPSPTQAKMDAARRHVEEVGKRLAREGMIGMGLVV